MEIQKTSFTIPVSCNNSYPANVCRQTKITGYKWISTNEVGNSVFNIQTEVDSTYQPERVSNGKGSKVSGSSWVLIFKHPNGNTIEGTQGMCKFSPTM